MSAAKPFNIPKKLVVAAFRAVKDSAGGAGIDKETIGQFESKLEDNLYKIWNRMSSGTYFPPPVKAVAIPKKSGGERLLGVPTVSDRVAQMVVKMALEPVLEPVFLPDSYGYRPEKSALDAVAIVRSSSASCGSAPLSGVSVAGSMIGFWSSTSKRCSITSSMVCC